MTTARREKRPTSSDVARLARVSCTTVSFVLNEVHTEGIPEETQARVRAAVAQLDYHPHEGARTLGRRASRVIGVALPTANNPHYLDIAAGIDAYAERHGYSVAWLVTNFDIRRERRCLEWLKQQRIDALIVSSLPRAALLADLRGLLAHGYLVTALGFSDDSMDSVSPARTVGERLILQHLVSHGHRHIGYIYGVIDQEADRFRLDACLALHHELGIPIVETWIRRCGSSLDDTYRATHALLQTCAAGTDRPTALVVANDYLAMGVLAALHEAGVTVPAAMTVASFDNTLLARYTVPPLTTIDYDARSMGEQAARLVIERLADRQRPPMHLETPVHVVVRHSTGPVPAALPVPGVVEKEVRL